MPLVVVRKQDRWRRAPGADKEQRQSFAIAARNVSRFARAFAEAVRALVTPTVVRELQSRAAAGATIEEIVAAIPWLEEARPEAVEQWTEMARRFEAAHLRVLGEAAADPARDRAAEVQKRARRVPSVPVNPKSVAWARERGAALVRDISREARKVVRGVVARSLERGERADAMARRIRRAVGLLEREEAAVERRRELLLSQGVPERRAEQLSDKYADELLSARATRIARTETIAAQNRGLLDSWRAASDAGALPPVVRVWVSAPPSDNPGRPCPICLELDGQETPLDEPFQSAQLGEAVMAPPSHPGCRCTQTLRRAEA
jgi:hypothetical protein